MSYTPSANSNLESELSQLRDEIIWRLGDAYADDLLPLAEYERRVVTAQQATDRAELDALLADLTARSSAPGEASVRHEGRIDGVSRAQGSESPRKRKLGSSDTSRRTVQRRPERATALPPEDEEALRAFDRVLSFAPANIGALRGVATVLRRNDDPAYDDQEVRNLELLDDLTDLSRSDLARLGYLKYRTAAYFDAIEYWRRALTKGPPQAYLCFNIGLAYNQKTVSQDADAVDMWRRALSIDPKYVRARRELDKVVPRLLDLATTVRGTGNTVLDLDQWYTTYLNPFELLDLEESTNPFGVDDRHIRKLKRALLHEIDLEDGHLPWLPGLTVERSRAITVLDELDHERLREHHALVFTNKRLLAFLSRGDHEHFLVDRDTSRLDLIDVIERDTDFREWLSSYFVSQYDRVLAMAIRRRNLPVIECLLDGRRWVLPSREDDCFKRARREVARLIEPITEARMQVGERKPSFFSVTKLLERSNVVRILNLLPTHFESEQSSAVEELRNFAVACFNSHRESTLSLQILELTRRFQFRSSRLNQLLKEDFGQIHDLIQQERRHEVHLKRGKSTWKIVRNGVSCDDLFISSTAVVGVTWGAHRVSKSGLTTMGYFVRFRDAIGRTVRFSWTAIDDWSDGSASPMGFERSQELFGHMVQASFEYVVPHVLERIQARMDRRESVKIGPYVFTTEGVGVIMRKWLFGRRRHVPWARVDVQVKRGVVTVTDRQQKRVLGSCNIHETENVMVLSGLAEKYGNN